MTPHEWFKEQEQASRIKAMIVTKYFWAWAEVMKSNARKWGFHDKLAYIDLFAGPGRYEDGAESTPLLILRQAVEDVEMCKMLVAVFNDVDEDHARSLKANIEELPGIEKLAHKPQVHNDEVGDEIVKMFEEMTLVPTFFFVDPWGYKGLSLRLVNSVMKDWGCDCVFFFNYNRISMGLSNERVKKHMDALFGEDRADELRPQLEEMDPPKRETAIVEALCESLKEMGGEYVLPFRFRHPGGSRTGHHLVFVTKNPLGYKIMKGIMAGESSTANQGVASFEYNPALKRSGLLFQLSRPLDELRDMLLEKFSGRTLGAKEIYDEHNVDTPYTEQNYKLILGEMQEDGTIEVYRPAGSRKTHGGRPSFGPKVRITFPEKD